VFLFLIGNIFGSDKILNEYELIFDCFVIKKFTIKFLLCKHHF